MAGNKFLQGQLNQPITRPLYHGITSDSVEITVDNSNMTIKGNVIWDSFLGTTLGKAYSGVDGKRDYEAILNLTKEFNTMVEQFVKYKLETNQRIISIENITSEVDMTVTDKLDKEIIRSIENDKELLDKIVLESQRALAAEATFIHDLEMEVALRANIDKELKEKIDSLGANLLEQIHVLSAKIDSIFAEVKSSETQLIEQITNETLRALQAEKELREALNSTIKHINEFESRITATKNSSSESAEIKLNDLSNLIKQETDRATKSENNIETELHKLDSTVNELFTNVVLDLQNEIEARKKEDKSILRQLKQTEETVRSTTEATNKDLTSVADEVQAVKLDFEQLTHTTDEELAEIEKNLDSKLLTEVNRAIESETSLDSKVETRTKQFLNRLNDMSACVEDETASRITADSELRQDIEELSNSTKLAVEHVDASIQTLSADTSASIDHILDDIELLGTRLNKDIATERDRSLRAEEELRKTVSANVTNVENSISKIQSLIEEETSSRITEVESLSAEVSTLKESSLLNKESINKLESDIVEIEKRSSVSSDEFIETLDKLKTEFTESTNSLSDNLEDEVSRATQKESELQTRLDLAVDQLEETDVVLENKIFDIKSQLDELRSLTGESTSNTTFQIDGIKSQIKEIETQVDEVSSKFSLLTATDAEIEEQILLLQQTASELNSDIEDIQTVVNSHTSKINKLESTTNNVNGNIFELNQRISATDTQLRDVNDILSDEIERSVFADASLHESISSTNDSVKSNTENIVKLRSDYVNLQNRVDTNRSDLISIHTVQDEFDRTVNRVAVETENVKNSLHAEIARARDEEEKLDQKIESAVESITNIEIKDKSQDETIISLVRSTSNVSNTVEHLERSSQIVSDNVDKLTNKVNTLEDSIEHVNDSVTNYITEIEHDLSIQEELLNDTKDRIVSLETEVDTVSLHNKDIDADIKELYKQIGNEIVFREDELKLVNINHAQEVRRSTTKDVEHDEKIALNTENILATEDRLSQAISVKEQESIKRDEHISNKLDICYDTLAEGIQTSSDELSSAILSEHVERVLHENEIKSQLNELEVVVRADDNQLKHLSTIVGKEIDSNNDFHRTTDVRLTNAEGEITLLKVDTNNYVRKSFTETEQVYVQDGSSTKFIPTTEEVQEKAIVKRDEFGNIQLPADTTTLGASNAVSKAYVESLIQDVREVLHEEMKSFSFDIIDGGKAPIKK